LIVGEQYPYLPTKGLKRSEISDLRARLVDDFIKLDSDFTVLVDITEEHLNNNISVQQLKSLVSKSLYFKSVLDFIEHKETICEAFKTLNCYWSFFDYELVKLFIQRFGDEKLKRLMEDYLNRFEQYCQRKIYEVPAVMTESGRKGFTLRIRIPYEMNSSTASDIKRVQDELQKIYGTKLYLEGYYDGSITLIVISLIDVTSITSEQASQLNDMGVSVHEFGSLPEIAKSSVTTGEAEHQVYNMVVTI
jgi:hypothetical protein